MPKFKLPTQSFLDSIDAVVLDLGGVLINLSPKKTFDAFNSLSTTPIDSDDLNKTPWLNIIYQYEKGKITSNHFRKIALDFFKISKAHLPDHKFDEFWSSLLLDFPSERIDYLVKLRKHLQMHGKRLLLLSNINEIHDLKSKSLLPSGKQEWKYFFDHAYLSYQMGHRKPDQGIYEKLISSEKLPPERLFFVDDLKINIDGALRNNMKGAWLDLTREDFVDLFESL